MLKQYAMTLRRNWGNANVGCAFVHAHLTPGYASYAEVALDDELRRQREEDEGKHKC